VYAYFNGLEMMNPQDEFWLYDWPINPISLPSIMVFKKIKLLDDEFMRMMEKEMIGSNRQFVKLIKRFGKYFF
jgi:hypothetical protein